MSADRKSLSERLSRVRPRVVPTAPPPAKSAVEPPVGETDARLPAPESGSEKEARLERARRLIRKAEKGWKERPTGESVVQEPSASNGWPPSPEEVAALPTFGAAPLSGDPFRRDDHDTPLASRYGSVRLDALRESSEAATARLQLTDDRPGVDLSRALFLDTETSGLSGGTGTLAFLIGVGWVEGDQFRVAQLLFRDPSGERAMLEELAVIAADRRDLVTYNGASFDIPLLETRFALNGIADPFADARHLDLLHPARRLFKPRHESAQLGVLERELLGVERDDDIPGSQIPQVFFDYLRHGPHPAMDSVLAHNRYDILTLAALSLRAVECMADDWYSDDPAYLHGAGHHFWRRGETETAIPLLEQALEAGLSGQNRDRCLLDLGEHRKRCGDWEGAVQLWRQVGTQDTRETLDTLEWFAKWEEHQRKDPAAALEHVEDALERLPRVTMRRELSSRYRSEFRKRAARLRRASSAINRR